MKAQRCMNAACRGLCWVHCQPLIAWCSLTGGLLLHSETACGPISLSRTEAHQSRTEDKTIMLSSQLNHGTRLSASVRFCG